MQYNEAVPDGAERVVSMAEKQATHRMTIEAESVTSDYKLARAGQLIGLLVVLAVLALAGYLAYLGATNAAVAAVAIDVVGLAAVFVYGSLQKRVIHEMGFDEADPPAE